MPPAPLTHLDLTRSYTYADYQKWKFELVELVKGKPLRAMSSPNRRQQDLVNNMLAMLLPFLRGRAGRAYHAPFDVRLPCQPGQADHQVCTVVQPDLCVVLDPAKLDARGCLGAPDWIVEVATPGHISRDTKIKLDLYQEHGVGEYWILLPGEQVVVAYLLEKGQYRLSAEYAEPGPVPVRTLPGLTLEWAEIFSAA
ncbi:MAG: Uma2 family endonuclease [Cytophagaceae bacterium]|nr:MAG: Uma2 family endonuclease [Cytophagaceae bacterium]